MSDHDDATIGRIFTRRQALLATARAGLLAGGAAVLGRPARSAAAAHSPAATRPAALVACPQLTEGPFFVDEKLNRSDLTAGTTRPGVVRAVPLLLTVNVHKLTGTASAPLPGAHFDVWSADAHGIYSDEDDPMNPEVTAGQTWLRGYQVTDANGSATFRTIVPSYYNGRTAHIHFKVRQFVTATGAPATRPTAAATAEFTSQLFFDDKETDLIYARGPYAGRGRRDTYNADDNVYTEPLADGSPAGAQMTLDLKDNPAGPGRTAAVTIYLTDASLHGGPSRRPGGPGGHGPGGPPPDDFMPW